MKRTRHRSLWSIDIAYSDDATAMLSAIFPDAVIEEAGRRLEPAPVRRSDQAFATLHLLPGASDELVEVECHFLARHRHPDTVGGDGERMRDINEAYAELKARVSA